MDKHRILPANGVTFVQHLLQHHLATAELWMQNPLEAGHAYSMHAPGHAEVHLT